MGDQSVTDLSYLREMAMGDDEIVVETAKIFLKNAPDEIENLREYFANQEWEKLYQQAHKIKPNLEYMGMERAGELILEIEEQARTQDISDDLENKINEFHSVCLQGLDELAEKIEELESN